MSDGDARDPEFQRGWDAALQAVQHWHHAKAKQAMIQSRRSRFPKAMEREAELHTQAAGAVLVLHPDDA